MAIYNKNHMNSSDWDDSLFSKTSSSLLEHYRNQKALGKAVVLIILIILLFTAFSVVFHGFQGVSEQKAKKKMYKAAVKLYENSLESYDMTGLCSARDQFLALSEYKDSAEYVGNVEQEISNLSAYNSAVSYYESRQYKKAFDAFSPIIEYRDSRDLASALAKELYSQAEENIQEEDYDSARKKLLLIPEYLVDEYDNARNLNKQIDGIKADRENAQKYQSAVDQYNANEIIKAQKLFIELGDYQDSKSYLQKIGENLYDQACYQYQAKEYLAAFEIIERIDSQMEWADCSLAMSLKQTLRTEYVEQVEAEALGILETSGYSSFKQFVKSSINGLFTSSEADAFLEAHKPQFLYELEAFDSFEWQGADSLAASGWQNSGLEFKDDVVDTFGNHHGNAMIGGGCANGYYLGGKYSRLTGTLFIIEDHSATVEQPVFIAVKNGNGEMLYSGKMMSGYDNLDFSVDVAGEEEIYIYFDGFYGNFFDSDYYGGVGELALIR